ncbi:Ribulokinase [Vibrio ruber DSM 16370]|uniref:Ribulokinase n=1 Tax=Vibrio ruber (strain DSM 16370 / JCM 11486 / BCRC 17186 / CECT 7878 / LMG 23124 / VR1) TaxID=1123498 RepID=A0A1R4LDJ9_VIBR1|nr:FGGY-family carbohydrate kinase [Vibrio ruber]SJN54457.1 Ribulokinase [Vibrio ruber DSM 16370]
MGSIYFIGVDVGSGSARAGVFDISGRMLAESKRNIMMFKPKANFVEQSSDDIWQCVCLSVKDAISKANVDPHDIQGIGFDATCSLVVLNKEGKPLTVSPTGRNEQNVIMWMDHRAITQANRINETKHKVLDYVGSRISPEMEMPKLMWLKQHKPTTWSNAGYFFDLPDFLTWKATHRNSRSLCSTVCKWTYLGHEGKWDRDFFKRIGLDDLLLDDAQKIGNEIIPMGQPVGNGLTAHAANDLGLITGTPVGTSIIDAHAGGIGVLGASNINKNAHVDFDRRLALIGGTSSCHMAVSKSARFIDGVWGAYYGAMVPDYWLNEGGQSATGALIDHIITSHPVYHVAQERAQSHSQTIYEYLNDILLNLAGAKDRIAFLAKDMHVLPYFHGNRSPRADPSLTGVMTGLQMIQTEEDLALQYLATIQSIALGTRHIIESLNQSGYSIDTIMACGGGTKNPIFIQEHVNATGCTMLLPEESEAVLLGSAMLGAVASGTYTDIPTAMASMSRISKTVMPQTELIKSFYDLKYKVFLEMYADDMKYRKIMGELNIS